MLSELQRFPRQFQVQQPSQQQQQPANTFFNQQQFQNIPQAQQRFVSPGFFNNQPQSTQQQQQQINQFGFPSGQGRVEVSSLPQPRFQPQSSSQSQLGIPPQSQFQVQPGANGVQQQSQQSLFEQQQSFFNQFQQQPNSLPDNQPQSAFQQNIFQPNTNPFTQQSLASQSNFQTAFSEVSRRAQSLGSRTNPALQNPAPAQQSLQINNGGRVTPSSLANPAASSPKITLFSPTLPPAAAGGQTRPVSQAGQQGLSFFPATPAPQQTSSGQGQGRLPGGNRQTQFR